MELGIIGLGRMGSGIAKRLLQGGHRVVVYDVDPLAVQRLVEEQAADASSLEGLVQRLTTPRAVWFMLPAGDPVEQTLKALLPLLDRGDVVIDGGNSYYRDTLRRAALLRRRGVHLVDAGVSGGIWGLTAGFSMTVGGDSKIVQRLRPIFQTLAPAPDKGWGHVGPSGAGHFVKMVHNGIEYGMMQAYAEGFSLMRHKTEFGLELAQIAEIWSHGGVVRSWLLDLIGQVLAENPGLTGIAPYVADSGEGRWAALEAIDLDVPAPVITLSLLQRLRSRDVESYGDKLLAALRHQFGGHAVKPESPNG